MNNIEQKKWLADFYQKVVNGGEMQFENTRLGWSRAESGPNMTSHPNYWRVVMPPKVVPVDMSTLDRSSTDPLHWATAMVEVGRTLANPMDEGWLLGWFANYGVAVYDQQQEEIEQLKARLKVLQDAAIQVNKDVWVLKLNAETKRALQGEKLPLYGSFSTQTEE